MKERDGLYRRGKIWWMSFREDRKPMQESTRCTNRREAEKCRALRISEVMRGVYVKETKATLVEELGERFMEYSTLFKRSWKRDEQLLGDLKRFFGNPALKDITAARIMAFQTARKEQVSNATTNRAVALLKRMFTMAERWGMQHGNPVRGVDFLAEETFNPRILTNEEAQKLVDASPKDAGDLLEFDLNTGLRKSDLYGLKWKNVDLEREVLRFVAKKTEKVQELPLNRAACDVLRRQPRISEYGFINPRTKKPIKDIRVVLNGSAERSGLGKFKLHTIRHTVATRVTRATDLATAQVLLGHESEKTTRRYVATDMPRMKNATDAIMWCPNANDNQGGARAVNDNVAGRGDNVVTIVPRTAAG